MGSGSKKTTVKPPKFIEDRTRQAAGLASDYAAKPFQAYTGDRIAGLASNEQQALDLASSSAGGHTADLDAARGAIGGVQDFSQFDQDTYMNPYIKGALDPVAREFREQGLRRNEELKGSLASRGAFSGSRAVLAQRESDELTEQSIGDLYGQGYATAFDKGTSLWQADQDRALKQGSQFMELAGMGKDLVNADIQNLMKTGEAARGIDQMQKDFDYGQFTEERDWGGKQAAYLTDVLKGLKGSYTETTKVKEKGDVLGQVLGAAATVAGAYFTGGASLAVQGATKAATGGETQSYAVGGAG